MGDRHLREALAATYGAPKKLVVKLAGFACMMVALTMVLFHESVPAPLGIFTFALALILLISGSVMAPRAPDSALEEERRWARSLPFTLEGYFEVLSAKPRETGGLRAHVTWVADGPEVDAALLADAFAAADPGARLDESDASGAIFASGPISGATGARINHVPVLRNHLYPEYVHALMTKVLVPLAKSHPIEKVRLEPV